LLCANNATSSQVWTAGVASNSTEIAINSTSTTVAGRCYHLVNTYDGSTLSLYVDGLLVRSQAKSGSINYESKPLYIGTSATNSFYMKGKVDDVRIYSRALSAQEVNDLYNLEKN
jgi:hypothetical protein